MSNQNQLVSHTQAAAMLGVSDATFRRMTLDGRAPSGIKVSSRICVWNESEIRELVKKREAEACAK